MANPNSYATPGPLGVYSDAARRIADAYALHLLADPTGNTDRWMAFRLDDGTCDPTLYDSKRDAMRAKGMFAKLYGFTVILPTGMNAAEAESYLRTCRNVADNPNLRWMNTDADAPEEYSSVQVLPFSKGKRPR